MRILFYILFLLLILGLAFGLLRSIAPSDVQTFSDAYITAGESRRRIDVVFPHRSPQQYLIFNGNRYSPIRGSEPYYIHIPELNSIAFVTESDEHRVALHLAALDSKKVVSVPLGSSGFGWNIGSDRVPGSPGTDYIVVSNMTTLRLTTRASNWEASDVIAVGRYSLEGTEVKTFDNEGHATNFVERSAK